MLDLEDADFRYPDSENLYCQRIEKCGWSVYSNNTTEVHRGNWREIFQDSTQSSPIRKLHVEVGCSAGHVAIEWAAQTPHDAYIGLDWKFKMAYRGAEKTQKRGIKNLIFLRGRSERIQYIFGPGEIDYLYLYFPDPWQKYSQRKNRFISPRRLREVAPLLKPGGVFHIKTDHAEYFEKMVLAANECANETNSPWEISELTRDLHAQNPDRASLSIPEVTLFERMFIREGIAIKSLKLKRRG